MAITIRLTSSDDLAEIVEALLAAADTRDSHAPNQATRWRNLACDIGDALDHLPKPTPPTE
ncbi:hypothetical protein [Streptomyces spiralis]